MRFEVMGSFFLISKTTFYPSSSILPCCKLSEGLKQTNLQIFISNHQTFLTPEIPTLFFSHKTPKTPILGQFPGATAPLSELQQALELSSGDADRAEAVVQLKNDLGALPTESQNRKQPELVCFARNEELIHDISLQLPRGS